MEKLRIDLPILLPSIDESDGCVALLTDRLAAAKGVEQAHLVGENGTAQLCIHFDPNLISLPQIERLAQDAGASVTDQYRHEQAAFSAAGHATRTRELRSGLDLRGLRQPPTRLGDHRADGTQPGCAPGESTSRPG
jgi:Cd2+/Zn2+-exporting ATPase